jgi:hypothetical protein
LLITVEKHIYKAFGLKIISDIIFPELEQLSVEYEDKSEISVEKNDVPIIWYELSSQGKRFIAFENLVMFQIEEIAIFTIQDGGKIVVSPLSDYDEDIARIYVLGTCMGSLLMQRKIFPLHGSAIAINGKAYAFVGDSGAGKSTLASAFINAGYDLLSDDVIAVQLSGDESTPIVLPSYPQQKLWKNSLDNFGMESGQFKSIYGRENKYCVPVSHKYSSVPIQLAGVFELVISKDNKIGIKPIEKLCRLNTIFNHTYRNHLIDRLGLIEWHFSTSVSVLNHIDLFQLCRPNMGFSAPQIVTLIQEIVNKEEKIC